MLMGADEVTLGKQWANSPILAKLSPEFEALGCLKRDEYVTVIFKQVSEVFLANILEDLSWECKMMM